jgi:hypothetical protein
VASPKIRALRNDGPQISTGQKNIPGQSSAPFRKWHGASMVANLLVLLAGISIGSGCRTPGSQLPLLIGCTTCLKTGHFVRISYKQEIIRAILECLNVEMPDPEQRARGPPRWLATREAQAFVHALIPKKIWTKVPLLMKRPIS